MNDEPKSPFEHLDAESTVIYTVGAPPRGWTRLRIDGGGDYELRSTVTADRQERHYCGTLPAERVQRLMTLLRDERVWEVTHVKKRAPGEPAARVEVAAGGRSEAVELWTSEVARVPAFQRVTEALVEIIREVSGGAVAEPGR
jgi:hypothetical protein